MSSLDWRAARTILICGAAILAISLGVRHTFGMFLLPVSVANGWGRETFALAIALQNLVWGIAQPFVGVAADRWGAGRIIVAGALLYAAGIALMTAPLGEAGFIFSAGVLIGIGLSGITFPIVFGAVSRSMPPEKRSLAFGITMSVGSFGQFVLLPTSLQMIQGIDWAPTLLVFSALALLMVPLAFAMMERGVDRRAPGPTARQAFRTAWNVSGFKLLAAGFFVCGFQVVFIATHLPSFLADRQLGGSLAANALALVGLFNVFGTFIAGWLGGKFSKPILLSGIYASRGIAIALYVLLPVTATSTYLFAMAIGFLWLSTVPLTNGTVSTMFGVRNLSMLTGVVFLSHQVGSFLGGWLGGLVYDRTGSYDTMWIIMIALSVVAALINLPIREKPVLTPAATGAAP